MESTEIIKAISELQTSLAGFNDGLRREITQLGQEINGKLDNIGTEIKNLSDRVEMAEARVEKVESWAEALTEVLATCLSREEAMRQQLVDLEARSRRNNIRIFGAGEGEEEAFSSVTKFVESLLRTKLDLPESLDLKIQRCHRSKPQRPPSDQQPRSIIVNFQEFTTKELVLKEAWERTTKNDKIKLNNRNLYFDNDYPTEVVKKRQAYSWIKKSLKTKGTRFQTPYTSMRIHWDSGVKTYSNATEAGMELKRRGYNVDEAPHTGEEEEMGVGALRELLGSWQKASMHRGAESGAIPTERENILQRARDKLQTFQRQRAGDTPSPKRDSRGRRGMKKK